MDDDAQQPVGRCGTSIHPQEDRQDHVIDLTVKQAMASSNYATYSKQLQVKEWYNNDYPATQDDVVRIHERFAHIYFNANVRAAMARHEDSESNYDYSKDKSVIVMDCGASVTITGSLLNCEDVELKITKIETAKEAESIMASHTCRKTHFVRNRLGEVVSITTLAIYVKGFPQDLLGGKSLNKVKI